MKNFFLLFTLLTTGLIAVAQNTVTGRVFDKETRQPLEGITVTGKGTATATKTDAAGNFRIGIPAGVRALVFSSAGLSTQEVAIGNQATIDVYMDKSVQSLDEVVVSVAYGQQEKKHVTGAVGKLSGRQFENVPLASVDQILQGKVAGLQSVATTGQPGALQQIRIRGIGSISASSAPLYVIDGIPVNSGDASGLTNSSNLLASLNPNDIESVSVLKDASAASIYGSRGANGVIIINTKKGKAGKTRIRVDAEFGTNERAYLPEKGKPLTRDQLKTLYIEGITNSGGDQSFIDFVLDIFGFNSTANYNWLDLVSRKGQQQQINVSASGGDTKTQFFVSGGFFKQESPVIGADIARYSANLALKHQLSRRISFGTTLNLSTFQQTGESESANFRNPVIAAIALRPTQEAFNADKTPNFDPNVFDQIYNPLAIRKYDRQNNQTTKLLNSTTIEYRPLDNLKLSSRFGIDYNNIEENLYQNPFFGDALSSQGAVFHNYTRLYNYVWTNLADYNFKAWQDKFDGSVTVGYESQKSKVYNQSANGEVVPKNLALTYPVPAVPKSAVLSGSDYSFVSLISRGQINFLGKYSLSGSLRRDGSSRFGANNRYGTFWSVAAAWNIDEESFLQKADFLSALKLRASYGVNGNAGIGNYDWRPTYSFGTTYNGSPGSFPENVGNPNLTWEQNKPFDVGIEAAFLQNRILIEADYYLRKTTHLLLGEPLSATSGFLTFNNNVGSMENKGVEFTINATPVRTKNFTWTISGNVAFNKNKVTQLRPGVTEIFTNPSILKVGYDVQSYYLRRWAGADPQNGDPLWYVDESSKATTNDVSQAQRAIVGSSSPKGFGGAGTSLTYKFITLDAQLNFQYGNYVYNQWDFLFLGDGAFFQLNHIQRQLERWQKPGDITQVPRFEFFNATSSNDVSTRYLYKGGFLRLRNVSLNVELPAKYAEKLHLSKLNVYARGTNLWTKAFDDNITMDPEQPVTGLSDLQFFVPKSITFGISVQL